MIGRSEIVGRPMAMLLLHANATVTMCHSRTPTSPRTSAGRTSSSPPSGVPGIVTAEMVKPGAACSTSA